MRCHVIEDTSVLIVSNINLDVTTAFTSNRKRPFAADPPDWVCAEPGDSVWGLTLRPFSTAFLASRLAPSITEAFQMCGKNH